MLLLMHLHLKTLLTQVFIKTNLSIYFPYLAIHEISILISFIDKLSTMKYLAWLYGVELFNYKSADEALSYR